MTRTTDLCGAVGLLTTVLCAAIAMPCLGDPGESAFAADTSRHLPTTEATNGPTESAPRLAGMSPSVGGWVTGPNGLESLEVQFDMPVVIPGDAVTVFDSLGTEITAFSRATNAQSDVLTLTFIPAITNQRVRVVVDYSVTSGGVALDGEILTPGDPVFPSGDGLPGGQSVVEFSVLAGDANRDGTVDAEDAGEILAVLGLIEGDPGFDPAADFNDDGVINVLDVATFTMNNGASLPPTDGTPVTADIVSPASGTGFGPSVDEIIIGFSEPVSGAALSARTLTLIDSVDTLIEPVGVTMLSPTMVAFELAAPLSLELSYRVGVSNAIADLSGELLDSSTSTFMLSPASDVSIFPPRAFPVGFGPSFAASGDVNGDKLLDFVVSNAADGTISVLLGKGDGTFQEQRVFFAGDTPRGLVLADFDDDSRIDVAVTLEGEDALLILYGDGSGSFGQGPGGSSAVITGDAPVSVASGLLDGDAIPDLAVVNHDSGTVSILFPQANRSVGVGPNLAVGGVPSSAVLGELTGDLLLDLAVTDEAASTLSIYTGLGDGNFDLIPRGGASFPTGLSPVHVGIGDLDNDKDLDLVTANKDGDSITIFLGTQSVDTRGFGGMEIAVGNGPTYTGIGDLDNDKDLDGISANTGGDSFTPVRQGPAGTFMATESIPTGNQPVFVEIADINGDGVQDVVTVLAREEDNNRGALVVRLGGEENTPDGQIQVDTAPFPVALALADVGGGDSIDMIVASADFPSTVAVNFGDGSGGFTPGPTLTAPGQIREMVVGDVVGSADRDIVVQVIEKQGSLYVFENLGDGTFSGAIDAGVGSSIVIADLIPDVPGNEILTSPFNTFSTQIRIYNLSFSVPQRGGISPIRTIEAGTDAVLALAVGDVSGNGETDIVAVGFNGVFSLGTARGSFDAGLVVFESEPDGDGSVGFNSFRLTDLDDSRDYLNIAVADLTGDMRNDVVVTHNDIISARTRGFSQGIASVFERTDEPYLTQLDDLLVGERIGPAITTDFSGDGIGDVTAASVTDDEVAVFIGSQGGGFFPAQRYETHIAPGPLAVGDVDEDSVTDLAILNRGSDDVTILLGQSPSSGGPDSFSELLVRIDNLTGEATPAAPFDLSYSGILELRSDVDSDVSQIVISPVPQLIQGTVTDVLISIEIVKGVIAGGDISITVNDGTRGGLVSTYTANFSSGGAALTEPFVGVFGAGGVTQNGMFSSPDFAGVDVSDWVEDQPLFGIFGINDFEPGAMPDTDVDFIFAVFEPVQP